MKLARTPNPTLAPTTAQWGGGRHTYCSEAGRARLRRDPTQRNDRLLQLRSQQCEKWPLTCGFGARGGIRTLDLPIRVGKPSSSRCRPGPFWLLTSAGSSSQCVLTCGVTAGGMTKGMTSLATAGQPAVLYLPILYRKVKATGPARRL
jgi:hypothetical protein